MAAAGAGPWSTDRVPVPVIDLDAPDGDEPLTTMSGSPGVSTPALAPAPEVIPPPTVSPEEGDGGGDVDDDDSGSGDD